MANQILKRHLIEELRDFCCCTLHLCHVFFHARPDPGGLRAGQHECYWYPEVLVILEYLCKKILLVLFQILITPLKPQEIVVFESPWIPILELAMMLRTAGSCPELIAIAELVTRGHTSIHMSKHTINSRKTRVALVSKVAYCRPSTKQKGKSNTQTGDPTPSSLARRGSLS